MILLNKPIGQTPLQALDKLRLDKPELKDIKLSYAGRLDPMAEGLLLVLVGDENNNRDKFLGLHKEYEVEILFGVETDTYDILGIASIGDNSVEISEDLLVQKLSKFIGKINLPYPPYSSKPVNGMPLFEWARNERLDEIVMPNQDSQINAIELIELYKIEKDKLEKYILDSIQKVNGDFRQDKIKQNWEKLFKDNNQISEFPVVKIKVFCESGAYMRSVAYELGRMMKTGAIALSIKRTRIGEHSI